MHTAEHNEGSVDKQPEVTDGEQLLDKTYGKYCFFPWPCSIAGCVVADAKANLGCYLDFCNTRRPHQTLDGKTPDAFYCQHLPKEKFTV
ncbi:MAG: hypothetical protein KA223_02115 [Candidatus Accumulibacter sp.]|nr:hypothetical protein [Accumulibacter sp.]